MWTTREGYESDLVEEISASPGRPRARMCAAALVASPATPWLNEHGRDLAFARQGFRVANVITSRSPAELDAKVTDALRASAGPEPRAWALHVWVPDSTHANRLARSAEVLQRAIEMRAAMVDLRWADRRVGSAQLARAEGGWLSQVALVEPGTVLVGGGPALLAPSAHPGGRARMRVSNDAPSRAAMKLEEALDWFGHGPSAGERCVDLGAAPGGWSFVVLERGARVLAIDPGSLAPELLARFGRRLEHVRGSAFDYEPTEPVDWLLCDMVWRPLEVAALLARWARRRWAQMLIANVKLPMRSKVEFVGRVRHALEEGGWREVRVRQLYHDREEVTVCAHR